MNPLEQRFADMERELMELKNQFYKGNYSGIKDEYKSVNFKKRMKPPVFTSAPATCEPGEVCSVSGVMKICSATNTWTNIGTATAPGGSTTQVQFNDGGAFGGDADFTYDNSASGSFVVHAKAGTGSNGGGGIELLAAAGAGAGAGGSSFFGSGDGGSTGNGGDSEVSAGAGGAVSGAGGNAYVRSGNSSTGSQKGSVYLYGRPPGSDTGGKIIMQNGDGSSQWLQGKIQTTNATPGTQRIFTLPDTYAVFIEARVVAAVSNGNSAGYVRRAVYKRNGAGPVLVGSIQDDFTMEDDANWDCSFAISTNDIQLQVTGVAATTIGWIYEIEYICTRSGNPLL